MPQTTLLERIKLLYKKRFSTDLLYYASKEFDLATKIQIVGGSPSLYRRDKKLIHIYLNKRKINEYALLQACEYGYSELLPGGAMPVCFAFIEVDPKTVDFNIHPAKKEAKIENINLIRSHLISLIKEFLSQFRENNNYIKLSEKIPSIADFSSSSLDFEMATNQGSNLQTNSDELDFLSSPKFKKIEPNEFFSKPENNFYKEQTNMVLHNLVSKLGNFKENNYTKTNYTSDSLRTQPEVVSEHPVSVADDKRVDAKLIGIFKNFFIIAEYQDKLFFIDQHAAHEKLIFNQLVKNKSSQPLLIPLPINSTNPNLDYTQEQLKALEAIGIKLEKLLATGSNNESEKIWHITALPGIMHSDVLTITKFLEELTCDTFEIEKSLFATIACKKAIKEGQPIDKEFATYIANSTLALDKPNCPHGRPLYFTLSHKELCFLVGRTL